MCVLLGVYQKHEQSLLFAVHVKATFLAPIYIIEQLFYKQYYAGIACNVLEV